MMTFYLSPKDKNNGSSLHTPYSCTGWKRLWWIPLEQKISSSGCLFPLTITQHGWINTYANSSHIKSTRYSALLHICGEIYSQVPRNSDCARSAAARREHAQREQVQRTAPAQLRSGLGQNCRVKRSEVLLKGNLRPLSTCVQQRNTLAFRLVHHHSRTIIISVNKGVTPSGLKSISWATLALAQRKDNFLLLWINYSIQGARNTFLISSVKKVHSDRNAYINFLPIDLHGAICSEGAEKMSTSANYLHSWTNADLLYAALELSNISSPDSTCVNLTRLCHYLTFQTKLPLFCFLISSS